MSDALTYSATTNRDQAIGLLRDAVTVVVIAGDAVPAPTWWVHLVLIYFKQLFLNRSSPRVCALRPVCGHAVDCPHSGR